MENTYTLSIRNFCPFSGLSNLSKLSLITYKTIEKLHNSVYSSLSEPLEISLDLTAHYHNIGIHILDNTTGEILFEIQYGRVIYAADHIAAM